MTTNSKKVSIKQAYTLSLLASFSPIARSSSYVLANYAGKAGWVSIIISCVIYCGLIWMLGAMLKNQENLCLYSVYKSVLGKAGASILIGFYCIWIFIFMSTCLRAFGERYTSSILPTATLSFFVIVMVAFCFVILQGKFAHFVKMSEIGFYAMFIMFLVIFVTVFYKIKPENILPITTYDTASTLKGTLPLTGIFCIITFLMLIGDEFTDKEMLRPMGYKSSLVLLITNLIVYLATVGMFGANLTKAFSLPFFMAIKALKFFNTIERLESIFLLLWIITDIAVIAMLGYILISLISKSIGEKKHRVMKTPVLLGGYVLSMYIAKSNFEVIELMSRYIIYMNIFFGVLVPVVIFAIGKATKKI